MPGLNSKGPNGEGPMTGRRMGRCKSSNILPATEQEQSAEVDNRPRVGGGRGAGKGVGRGVGRGAGRGRI